MEKEITQIEEVQNKKVLDFTPAAMNKEAKKLDKQTAHPIAVGENLYNVKIDNVFRKTKQHKLLDDLVEFFDASNSNVELLELTTPYTTLLFIKHFTNIDVSDNIDEALETLGVLIDLDVLNNVLNSMPEDQVIEVYEILNSTVSRMKENMIEAGQEAERLSETVENIELKEMLKDGKFRQSE